MYGIGIKHLGAVSDSNSGRTISIPLGIVVARERIDNPWQEYAWQAVSVFLDPPPLSGWRELRHTAAATHYHIANLPLELHRREVAGYRVNLANGVASIYIILREGAADGGDEPIHAHLVTASPFDVEAYGHTTADIVGRVAMPDPLVAAVAAFNALHHREEPFVKRQRQPFTPEVDEHKFGQEPIHILRERMRTADRGTPQK